ncbi:hypothetical protein [Flaviaesturariibacter amylovorans]|uniref:Uncharacterized protein n=1 Tax=Flaviaesturariibacter amylovorans TaxID=1084520 RepID=A0ABP8GR10_9BACT
MRPAIDLHPEAVDLSPLAPFIEHGADLPKTDLLHRAAGKVEAALIVYLKSVVFSRILKDSAGRVYLL